MGEVLEGVGELEREGGGVMEGSERDWGVSGRG